MRDWGTKDVFPLRCQRLTLSRWGLHLQQDYKSTAAGSVERKQPMADGTCENVTGYENFVGLSVSFSNSTNFVLPACVKNKTNISDKQQMEQQQMQRYEGAGNQIIEDTDTDRSIWTFDMIYSFVNRNKFYIFCNLT